MATWLIMQDGELAGHRQSKLGCIRAIADAEGVTRAELEVRRAGRESRYRVAGPGGSYDVIERMAGLRTGLLEEL